MGNFNIYHSNGACISIRRDITPLEAVAQAYCHSKNLAYSRSKIFDLPVFMSDAVVACGDWRCFTTAA